MKVVVTGGTGKAGRAVVSDLMAHGYEVLNVDLRRPAERTSEFLQADITDYGQTVAALHGAEAVVHLGAIPAPGLQSEEVTFRTNITSTYNVFEAARILGLQRVVWASSETTLGLPFDRQAPIYAPIDEEHPLFPETSYALSKVLDEEIGRQFNRWTGIPVVSLRLSNIMEPHDYAAFPTFQDDPFFRKWNLWGYVDARDVAQSCRLGLEAPNAELMARVFPGVPLRKGTGEHETLLSIAKAQRVLGYAPAYSWRELV